MDHIARRVQARMEALGTNSAEVARRAGLERTFVHDLVSGRKKSVTADALIALSIALQCLPEELVGRSGEVTRPDRVTVPIAGLVEPGAWRSGLSVSLGAFTLGEGEPSTSVPYLVKTTDAASFGIANGSIITVDPTEAPKAGDIVLVERKRDDLTELSVRKFAPLGSGTKVVLVSPAQQEVPPVCIPSERPGETVASSGAFFGQLLFSPTQSAERPGSPQLRGPARLLIA